MRSDAPGKEDVRLRRKAAAFRLKHDLGKYIRFNAPGNTEEKENREISSTSNTERNIESNGNRNPERDRKREDVEVLRERLKLDLLSTRRRGSTAQSAVDVFFEWKKEEAAVFEEAPRDDAALRTIAQIETLVETLRPLLPKIFTFKEKQLRDLDLLSLETHRACLRLWKQTLWVSSSSSSVSSGIP